MSAAGGTPVQTRGWSSAAPSCSAASRRSWASASASVLARALVPLVQAGPASYLGPFDVPWLHLAGVAGVRHAQRVPGGARPGLPRLAAGRRRGPRRPPRRPAPSLRSPLLGLVLLGAGIVGSVVGATGGGEILIAASAIPAVLGMILLVPLVLAGLGRVSGRLPLVLRYAVRDAARHRTRTVPAVAAVAATVAGVVALGVGLTSDEPESRETYTAFARRRRRRGDDLR